VPEVNAIGGRDYTVLAGASQRGIAGARLNRGNI
jgi:hypothetical protein